MAFLKIAALAVASVTVGAQASFAQDEKPNPPSDAVVQYAKHFVAKNISGNAALNEAIQASTEKHKRLGYDESTVLDSQWRVGKSGVEAEAKAVGKLESLAADTPMEEHVKAGEDLIKAARENEISAWLIEMQEQAEPAGAITEIFVMDGIGWNVAQTGGTSDYFQGDEGKWQMTYASADPNEIEVLDIVEEDGIRYAQVSLPVKDGDTNIGAITVGVDVDKVQ